MQVTVFGAAGKVGSEVTRLLLDEGHSVVAFVHRTAPLEHTKLQIVRGDIHDAAAVAKALQGSQAVVSALGSWHTKTKDILSSAMQSVLPEMEHQGITRIVTVTGSAAQAPGEQFSVAERAARRLFSSIAPAIISDAELHLQLLADSKADWTVIRAGVMSGRAARPYTLNHRSPQLWELVSRRSVARAMVDQLTAQDLRNMAVHIHD